MKKDIENEADIRLLVDSFYDKVNHDQLLSPVFNQEANVNWESHLPKMYAFWGTQLIGSSTYSGRPFPPHMELTIDHTHFNRWLELFKTTVTEHFSGPTADLALYKAANIANVFQYKLGLIRD